MTHSKTTEREKMEIKIQNQNCRLRLKRPIDVPLINRLIVVHVHSLTHSIILECGEKQAL